MKVKELIMQLLNEDMDNDIAIESTGPYWVVLDGIRPDTGKNAGIVLLIPNMELKNA